MPMILLITVDIGNKYSFTELWRIDNLEKIVQQILRNRCTEETLIFKIAVDLVTTKNLFSVRKDVSSCKILANIEKFEN